MKPNFMQMLAARAEIDSQINHVLMLLAPTLTPTEYDESARQLVRARISKARAALMRFEAGCDA